MRFACILGAGGSYSDLCVVQQPPAPPAGEDWNLLPRPLQLQLHLLNCLDMLTKQWAAAGLPVSADHVLLEQQLLPRSVLLQRLQAGRRLEHLEVLHKALDWQRHVALKVRLAVRVTQLAVLLPDCVI